MIGDEGTAQMFGEMFRNIFGWSATRPSALDKELYNDLYRLYIQDEQQLGIRAYFQRVNPAALQAMTAVMLESARKGYWKATAEQLHATAAMHAQVTKESGAACTDFVCNNAKLQQFVALQLSEKARRDYNSEMSAVKNASSGQKDMVLKDRNAAAAAQHPALRGALIAVVAGIVLLLLLLFIRRRKGRY